MSKQTKNEGMIKMSRQAVLDVLNNLPVFESQGGEDCYILVEFTDEIVNRLESVGISKEKAERYGDKETFCILALAFSEGYANNFVNGKLDFEYETYLLKSSYGNEYFDTYKEANEAYEEVKEILGSEGHEPDELISLYKLEPIKHARSVVDEERMKQGTPKEEGYTWDFWAKWDEEEFEEVEHG